MNDIPDAYKFQTDKSNFPYNVQITETQKANKLATFGIFVNGKTQMKSMYCKDLEIINGNSEIWERMEQLLAHYECTFDPEIEYIPQKTIVIYNANKPHDVLMLDLNSRTKRKTRKKIGTKAVDYVKTNKEMVSDSKVSNSASPADSNVNTEVSIVSQKTLDKRKNLALFTNCYVKQRLYQQLYNAETGLLVLPKKTENKSKGMRSKNGHLSSEENENQSDPAVNSLLTPPNAEDKKFQSLPPKSSPATKRKHKSAFIPKITSSMTMNVSPASSRGSLDSLNIHYNEDAEI